jgi:hypothetical protein
VEREGGLGVDGDANEDEVQVIQERQAEGRAGARGQGECQLLCGGLLCGGRR